MKPPLGQRIGNRQLKLIVQIPCYNEEQTLPLTVADIPRNIPGIDRVEILVIDDGSDDRTADVAREIGVDHILRNKQNQGLARSFARGLNAALQAGADIVVNTDGDNQYSGGAIPDLIAPILAGRADIVIGDRQTGKIAHFSGIKKTLQRSGSWLVRYLSGVAVPDAVSGFRAYSREAALKTNVLSEFSYTIETLIQAGCSGMTVVSVPVATNPMTRESRLFTSIPGFIRKQLLTLIRSYVMYRPLRVFSLAAVVLIVIGLVPIVRFVILFLMGEGAGKIQSLVLGGVLFISGALTFAIALLADAIAMNRRLLERTLAAVRRIELLHGLSDAEFEGDRPETTAASEPPAGPEPAPARRNAVR